MKKEANVDFYNVLIEFYKFCVTDCNIFTSVSMVTYLEDILGGRNDKII